VVVNPATGKRADPVLVARLGRYPMTATPFGPAPRPAANERARHSTSRLGDGHFEAHPNRAYHLCYTRAQGLVSVWDWVSAVA
jgi:hypothetical protein